MKAIALFMFFFTFWAQAQGPGISVGMITDPQINQIHPEATRFYYAGATQAESVRPNALGDEQVLFYDVIRSKRPAHKVKFTAIFIHGGGYQVGAANNSDTIEHCEQLRKYPVDCVLIEYRRGYMNSIGTSTSVGDDTDITAVEAAQFEIATALALQDVKDAWAHLHAVARPSMGLNSDYFVMGKSAGSSLAMRSTIANPDLTRKVKGVLIAFGTGYDYELPLAMHQDIPIFMQSALFDRKAPFYTTNSQFDSDMPLTIGMKNFYQELDSRGYKVRHYIDAQNGHGFGAWETINGLGQIEISYFPEMLNFFKQASKNTQGPNYEEWYFSHDDALDPITYPRNFVVNTLEDPGFRYEPYQSMIETLVDPQVVIDFYNP